ncbi:LLM class oxidoreductase [Dactylosporangium darangshiense]|uniref:hypothetical protein n=1 Tax=Dactylosporangium darangshiense TaxID=579108 RepID=UPI0031E818A2
MSQRPLHFAAFVMNTTGHIIQGTWRRPTARQADFNRLDLWVDLARTIDFGHEDLDRPVGQLQTEGVQSILGWINDLVTDRPPTLRDVAHYTAHNGRITGTPEQIADALARWRAAGVDGINVVNAEIPGSYEEFVEHVVPVLRERGLARREYPEGTLRQKLFGRGDRLPATHPAARYRGAFTAVSA